jgi:hypothetical protein
MHLQIILSEDPLAGMPALPLIDAQDGDDLSGRLDRLAAEEVLNVGLFSVPPKVFELLGWS